MPVNFDRQSAERIATVVKAVENHPTILSRPNRKGSKANADSDIEVTNSDSVTLIAGSLVELLDYDSDTNIYNCSRPTAEGIKHTGIVVDDIAASGSGGAWREGKRELNYRERQDDYGTTPITIGCRLGAVKEQLYSSYDRYGQYRVVGIISSGSVSANGTALVEIETRRD